MTERRPLCQQDAAIMPSQVEAGNPCRLAHGMTVETRCHELTCCQVSRGRLGDGRLTEWEHCEGQLSA